MLLQLAHPFVAHAIRDHSRTQHDVVGRFARTFRAVFAMSFGDLDHACRAARAVHGGHARVVGTLDDDAVEADNRAKDPDAAAVFTHLRMVLREQRAASVPERNQPWPYAARQPRVPDARQPPPPARLLRRLAQRLGMHPEDTDPSPELNLVGRRALIVCTNHGLSLIHI